MFEFVLLAIGKFYNGTLNKQNQILRQKVCLYIYILVILRCLPSLDIKHELFVTRKSKKKTDSQAWVRQTIIEMRQCPTSSAQENCTNSELHGT